MERTSPRYEGEGARLLDKGGEFSSAQFVEAKKLSHKGFTRMSTEERNPGQDPIFQNFRTEQQGNFSNQS